MTQQKQKQICAVACSNGLGHIRRLVAVLAQFFSNENNYSGVVLAPLGHLKKMESWGPFKLLSSMQKIKFIDFDSGSPETWIRSDISVSDRILKKYPGIMDDHLVISDNLHQVLRLRPDTLLFGSFFWHEVFEYKQFENPVVLEYVRKSRNLIASCKPLMVGQEDFATPDVKTLTKFRGVGFYNYNNDDKKYTPDMDQKNGLLISVGLTNRILFEWDDVLETILDLNIKNELNIFVEPRLLPPKYPSYVFPAKFDIQMFTSLIAACSRPGMGTLSDVILSGARFFAFHEDNFEMQHNSRVLSEMNMGEQARDATEALLMAKDYSKNKLKVETQFHQSGFLNRDGINQTAQQLSRYR